MEEYLGVAVIIPMHMTCYDNNESYEYDSVVLAESVCDAMKGYNCDKNSLISMVKRYCKFLENEYGLKIKEEF